MVPASAFEQTVAVSDPCFTAIEDQSENLFLRPEMLVKKKKNPSSVSTFLANLGTLLPFSVL